MLIERSKCILNVVFTTVNFSEARGLESTIRDVVLMQFEENGWRGVWKMITVLRTSKDPIDFFK